MNMSNHIYIHLLLVAVNVFFFFKVKLVETCLLIYTIMTFLFLVCLSHFFLLRKGIADIAVGSFKSS